MESRGDTQISVVFPNRHDLRQVIAGSFDPFWGEASQAVSKTGSRQSILFERLLTPSRASRSPVEPVLEKEEDVMKKLAQKVQQFLVSEDGPTAVEYAVMLALIVIVCLTAIRSIGTNAAATFNNVAGQLGS